MQWKLDKYVVEETIKYIRRVFTYNDIWVNAGIEVFQLPSGSLKGHIAFEQFFQEREKYPVITVAPGGGNFENLSFNDYIETTDEIGVHIGTQGNAYYTVGVEDLIFKVPDEMLGESLQGMNLNMAANPLTLGGDDIIFSIIEDYGNTNSIVSTVNIDAIYNTDKFSPIHIEFDPVVQISSGSHISISSPETSSYFVMVDRDYDGRLMTASGSWVNGGVVGDMRLPKSMRFGSNYASSIIIRCSVKNDTALLYEMVSIVSQYLMLAKHAVISRQVGAVDGMEYNNLSEFLKKGIHIKNIVKGNVDTRKRSSNDIDIVHTVGITVNVLTEWFQDYPVDTVKEVVVDTITFTDNNLQV